ncbi:MAG: hypothetical protein HQ518_24895, partial [Rhodopirellula sp.]|nr:hypothetical protein [Rhodopirellula sp.]
MPKRKRIRKRTTHGVSQLSREANRDVANSGCGDDRIGSWLLTASLLTAAFVWSCSPMQGFDIWWHLKTGQLIIERQTLPFVDWYTYSDPDAAWVDLHWGFQLLAAVIYRVGGVTLLVLAKAVCITAAVAIGFCATSSSVDTCVRAAVWTLVAIVVTGRGIVRPEILSLVFLAAWLSILV